MLSFVLVYGMMGGGFLVIIRVLAVAGTDTPVLAVRRKARRG